ncbi:MAG: LuxR C-terminal-related transcriptional regulator [Bacteroidota bacterium]
MAQSSHDKKAQQARLQYINNFADTNHSSDPAECIHLMAEAAEIYREEGEFHLQARSLWRQAFSMRELLQFEEIVPVLESAFEICIKHGFKRECAKICGELGSMYQILGNFTKSRENIQRSLDGYRELNDVERQVITLSDFANLNVAEGKFTEALQHCNAAFLICEENSIDLPGLLWVIKGVIFSSIGDGQRALDAYVQSLEITRQDPLSEITGMTLSAMGELYWHKGEPEIALEYMKEGIKEYRRTKCPDEEMWLLCNVAGVLTELNRVDEAEEYIAKASNILKGREIPAAMLPVLTASAKLQQAKGNPDEALRILHEALMLSEQLNEFNARTRIFLEKGRLHTGSEQEGFLKNALAMSQISGQKQMNYNIHFALYEYYQNQGDSFQALEHFKTYQLLKDEMLAEKTRLQMDILKVENEMQKIIKEAEDSKIKLKELTSDLIQRNEVLSEIRKLAQHGLQQKGIIQKKSLSSIVRTTEAGATSFWKQLEERSELIDKSLSEKVLDLCPDFTSIQLRILTLLKARLSNKEIAQLLFITERAVEYHRTVIRKKLHLSTTTNISAYLSTL